MSKPKNSFSQRALVVAALAAVLAGPAIPQPASAGCGCDHPPPAWAVVMPPFAWAKQNVTIHPEGGEFVVGAEYEVDFDGKHQRVVAESPARLVVEMPSRVKAGPVEIKVKGEGYDHKYDEALFTALPKPFKVKPHSAALFGEKIKVAVTQDGVLLVPVDLSKVQDPMQFALQLEGLPLDFEQEDVVLYNAQGVDLTVFTMDVADATQRQWGSYYGWEVEEDTGLTGVRYEHKVKKSKGDESDVFMYWRHEFFTYAKAHAPGGSHEVNADGLHPDGTAHIDHDHLVIAIHGLDFPLKDREELVAIEVDYEADAAQAQDADELEKARKRYREKREKVSKKAKRLKGGHEDVGVHLLAILAERPMEPDEVLAEPLPMELVEIEEE